jgi:hypothetical protein
VLVGDLEKLDDAWPFKVPGATVPAFKMAAYGACDAILIYLAYVHEEVTVLGAAVIPVLKELGNLGVMGSQASGSEESKAAEIREREVNAHSLPPRIPQDHDLDYTETRNSHTPP